MLSIWVTLLYNSDTFASKVAAINDQYADSSIGNVTGSNAVNVFLGIGVAWSIAAIYHAVKGTQFLVKPGSLGFSVTVFCIFAVSAILVILLRRRPSVGGELGGPKLVKYLSAVYFFSLWFAYIVLAGLENYCHIEGFWAKSNLFPKTTQTNSIFTWTFGETVFFLGSFVACFINHNKKDIFSGEGLKFN